MATTEIIETGDGSHSLFHRELNETYHSRHGAVQESLHVYITHGLHTIRAAGKKISVLEIGFGTGLNALLTQREAEAKETLIFYHTLEPYPIDKAVWSQLNYGKQLGDEAAFNELHTCGFGNEHAISPHFTILKQRIRLHEVVLPEKTYDCIYFDAFAPDKQPDMWSPALFMKLKNALRQNGCLVTYCAKGQVKRDFRSAGFEVETLPGPPGKREMIRCTYTNTP